MNTPSPIDIERLYQTSGGDAEFEKELLELFIEDTQPHLANLTRALAEKDFDRLQMEAHYIKGASINMGANMMHSLALQLELAAKQANLDSAGTFNTKLVAAFEAVKNFRVTKDN